MLRMFIPDASLLTKNRLSRFRTKNLEKCVTDVHTRRVTFDEKGQKMR